MHKVDIDQLSSMCHVSLKPIEYSDKIYINKSGQLYFQSESVWEKWTRANLIQDIVLKNEFFRGESLKRRKEKLKSSFWYSDSPMNDHERFKILFMNTNKHRYIHILIFNLKTMFAFIHKLKGSFTVQLTLNEFVMCYIMHTC